jgi:DNA-binding transcriptional LysR family regulator
VHFLLCHHHSDVPANFDSVRFPSTRLGSDTLVALCSPDAEGRPKWPIPCIADKPTRVLAYSQASGLGRILAAHESGGSAIAGAETVFTSQLAATLMTMAREGHGVAWLPLTLAEEDLGMGRLVSAGSNAFDVQVEIRLFRSPDCRSRAADQLWSLINEAGHRSSRSSGSPN